jgi:hypothetical protein
MPHPMPYRFAVTGSGPSPAFQPPPPLLLPSASPLPVLLLLTAAFHLLYRFLSLHVPPRLARGGGGRGRARRRVALYGLSFLHAVFVSAASVGVLWSSGPLVSVSPFVNEVLARGDEHVIALPFPLRHCGDYEYMHNILTFSLAYFAHDLLVLVQTGDWRKSPADLLHHLLGILLVASCMGGVVPTRLAHHILITEASTPLLNLMWLMRKLGKEGAWPFRLVLLPAFLLVFAATRIVYLPLVTFTAVSSLRESLIRPYPFVGLAMVLLCVLNFYWATPAPDRGRAPRAPSSWPRARRQRRQGLPHGGPRHARRGHPHDPGGRRRGQRGPRRRREFRSHLPC